MCIGSNLLVSNFILIPSPRSKSLKSFKSPRVSALVPVALFITLSIKDNPLSSANFLFLSATI